MTLAIALRCATQHYWRRNAFCERYGLGAVRSRDAGVLIAVGGDKDAVDVFALLSMLNGECEQRDGAHLADVLVRDALGPAPGRDEGENFGGAPALGVGCGTPALVVRGDKLSHFGLQCHGAATTIAEAM